MKPTDDELAFMAISALENLAEDEDEPRKFYSIAEINAKIEEDKDWDSDNLKRGRLAKVSNAELLRVLSKISGKQLKGMTQGCHIEVSKDSKFQFREF
jgi:hypothetical protein